MSIKTPQAPVLNNNGSGSDDLLEGFKDASMKIRAAIEAVGRAYPHARDFQTAPDGSYEQARREHEARLRDLHRINQEYVSMGMAVQQQQDEIARLRRKRP